MKQLKHHKRGVFYICMNFYKKLKKVPTAQKIKKFFKKYTNLFDKDFEIWHTF